MESTPDDLALREIYPLKPFFSQPTREGRVSEYEFLRK